MVKQHFRAVQISGISVLNPGHFYPDQENLKNPDPDPYTIEV